jgi:hypothetical protein
MRSRAIRPVGFPIYVARVPAAPFARCYPRSFTFYVADPSAPLKLVCFPRFDSCAPAHFETRSPPGLLAPTHRGFAFYVAFPKTSIRPLGLPIYVATVPGAPFSPLPVATLPSISKFPFPQFLD